TISGTSSDNQGVKVVKIAIQVNPDNDPAPPAETQGWYNGNDFTGGTAQYFTTQASDGYFGGTSENWQIDVSTWGFVTDNKYLIRSKATDISNREQSSPTERTFTYDTEDPQSVVTSPADDSIVTASPEIKGTASENGPGEVSKVEVAIMRVVDDVYWDNTITDWDELNPGLEHWTEVSASSPAYAYWLYIATPTWTPNYKYTIWSRATDNAVPSGNEEVVTSSNTFHYDPNSPTSSVNVPVDSYYQSLTQLSGTADDDGTSGSGVVEVKIRIRDLTEGATYWKGGANKWQPGDDSQAWRVVDGTISWTYAFSDSDWTNNHTYWINTRAKDDGDNYEVNFATTEFTFDNEQPDSIISTPTAGGYYSQVKPLNAIKGEASDNASGVKFVEVRIKRGTSPPYWDGNTWVAVSTFTLTTGTTSWSYTDIPNWVDGEGYTVNSRATDDVDIEEVSISTVTFTYDTGKPTSTVTMPGMGGIYGSMDELSGTAEDGTVGVDFVDITIQEPGGWYWDGVSTWTASVEWLSANYDDILETWTYDSSTVTWLNDNTYTIKTRATDKAENEETVYGQASFTYDTDEPSSGITTPASDGENRDSLTTILGTSSDNQGVSVVKIAIQVNPDNDPAPPAETQGWYNGNDFTGGTAQYFSVEAVDGYFGGTSENWQIDVSTWGFVTDNKYLIRSKATDISNREQSSPTERTFTYDTEDPQSTITLPADNSIVTASPEIKGTSSDNGPGEVSKVEVAIMRKIDSVYWDNTITDWDELNPGLEHWTPTYSTTSYAYWVYTATPTWTPNYKYTIWSRATDDAIPTGNEEVVTSSNTFHYDPNSPTSSVNVPSAAYYKSLTQISGTADDDGTSGSGVVEVKIRIRDLTEGTTYWKGGANKWQPGDDSQAWRVVDGTTSWTYTFSDSDWTNNHTYWINTRAKDDGDNYEVNFATTEFTFDNEQPDSTISTPTAGGYYSQGKPLNAIKGEASDNASGVKFVEVRIKRGTSPPYWDGNTWVAVSTFTLTTGTTSWSYTDIPNWVDGEGYTVNSRATDDV
ncbi:MAG: hypothetical protein JSW41_00930, partial [Candidatus Aenigmatarchaeota archaeon]